MADGEPFEKDSDLSIKRNDWPYGIDERISHLVVWTKFPLEEDPTTGGDLSDRQRKQIDDYVEKTFRVQCGSDNVSPFPPCGGRYDGVDELGANGTINC